MKKRLIIVSILVVPSVLSMEVSVKRGKKTDSTAELFAAVKNENASVNQIKELLDAGAKINAVDQVRRTALMHAAFRGKLEVCKLLLSRGAFDQSKDVLGNTALNLSGSKELYMLFKKRKKCRVIEKMLSDKDKYTESLMSCIFSGSVKVCKLLLDRGASLETADEWGDTPLIRAIQRGKLEICKLLLDRGASPKTVNKSGTTPLIAAIREKSLEVCKLLLDRGASLETVNEYGDTPLIKAIEIGRLEICKLLLNRGARIDVKSLFGGTPLIIAIGGECLEICKLLLNRGALIDDRGGFGQTPLIIAIKNGMLEACKLLLGRGASIEVPDSNGNTPLDWAVHNGHLEVCKLLIKRGAELNSEICRMTKVGTELHSFLFKTLKLLEEKKVLGGKLLAIIKRKNASVKTVKKLLDEGAFPSGAALVLAVKNNRVAICTLLVSRGAELTSAVWLYANRNGLSDLRELLATQAWVLPKLQYSSSSIKRVAASIMAFKRTELRGVKDLWYKILAYNKQDVLNILVPLIKNNQISLVIKNAPLPFKNVLIVAIYDLTLKRLTHPTEEVSYEIETELTEKLRSNITNRFKKQ